MLRLAACFHWYVLQIHGPFIVQERSDKNVVLVLLQDLQCPSRDAAQGKDGDEHVFRDAHKLVDGTGKEVHDHRVLGFGYEVAETVLNCIQWTSPGLVDA